MEALQYSPLNNNNQSNQKITVQFKKTMDYEDKRFDEPNRKNRIKITVKEENNNSYDSTDIQSISNADKKRVLNKLEETYWASWKPNKTAQDRKAFSVKQYIKNQLVQVDLSQTNHSINVNLADAFVESNCINNSSQECTSYKLPKLEIINENLSNSDTLCDNIYSNVETNIESPSVTELFKNKLQLDSVISEDNINLLNSESHVNNEVENVRIDGSLVERNDVEIKEENRCINKSKRHAFKERLQQVKRNNLQKTTIPITINHFRLRGPNQIKPLKKTTRNNFCLGNPGSSLFVTRRKPL